MTKRETRPVGYMSPPEHTRFKKGTSGNPGGRPRKRKDLNSVLRRVLNRKVRIRDDGRNVPIRDALIWKLRDLALQGDRQALALQRRIIGEAGAAQADRYSLEEDRIRVLRAFERMGVKVTRSRDGA